MFDLSYMLLHEKILFFMGIAFFIILIFILVQYVRNDKDVKVLLSFFIIPIIMIGWTSIKLIKFGNTIEIIKKELNDSTKTSLLKENLEKIDNERIKVIYDKNQLDILKQASKKVGDTEKSKIIDNQLNKIKK